MAQPVYCRRCDIELLSKSLVPTQQVCAHCRASEAEQTWIMIAVALGATVLFGMALFQWLGYLR